MVVIRYTQVYVDISEFLKGTYLRLFSNLRFKRGSVCTIKLLCVMICITLFCILEIRLILVTQANDP